MSQVPDDPKEAAAEPPKLEQGATLAERFRVGEPIPGPAAHTSYLGRELDTDRGVVLIPVSKDQAKAVAAAENVEHAHLGRLFEIVELDDERSVLVAEKVEGGTLAERLAGSGKKSAVDAVRSALRVTDALNALHDAGAVQGFVHAGSVVVAPEGREAPVLVFFPAGDGEPLHAPERAPEAAPTIADDTWAAAGLLFWMLTGAPPAKAGYASEEELVDAGITDKALRSALFATLATDFTKRQSNLKPLRRELARWFVEHAGEEPLATSPSHHPPPLPPGSRSPGSVRPSVRASQAPPPPTKRRLVVFAGVAIALGALGGIVLAFFWPKKQVEVVEVAPPPPEPVASTLEIGEVPVTATDEQRLGNKLAACVAGYLPKGTFGKSPEVDWVCSETDPRVGGEKLRVAIVTAAPKGQVTDAMKIFARIGWYEMPAFAMVRAGCCPDAKPLALPESQCGMDAALREVGDAAVSVKDVQAALKKYTESIHCELNKGSKLLKRTTRPEGGEDTAFLDLVKSLE